MHWFSQEHPQSVKIRWQVAVTMQCRSLIDIKDFILNYIYIPWHNYCLLLKTENIFVTRNYNMIIRHDALQYYFKAVYKLVYSKT